MAPFGVDLAFHKCSAVLSGYLNYDLLPADFVISQQIQTGRHAFFERPLLKQTNSVWLDDSRREQLRKNFGHQIVLEVFVLNTRAQGQNK